MFSKHHPYFTRDVPRHLLAAAHKRDSAPAARHGFGASYEVPLNRMEYKVMRVDVHV